MVPTLQVGQRVLVNRIGARFSRPDVGDIVVFHPPRAPRRTTVRRRAAARGEVCDQPTPRRPKVNFIKRVVAGPGDTIASQTAT
jgi:signal peptidase I